MSTSRQLLFYILFAILASGVNLGAQSLFAWLWTGPWELLLSMCIGTGTGLVLKYVLDKKWVFQQERGNAGQEARTFLLYTLMGLFTTFIFWGVEWAFDYAWRGSPETLQVRMRMVGAAIGLAIGYVTKYFLDRRFVFRT